MSERTHEQHVLSGFIVGIVIVAIWPVARLVVRALALWTQVPQ